MVERESDVEVLAELEKKLSTHLKKEVTEEKKLLKHELEDFFFSGRGIKESLLKTGTLEAWNGKQYETDCLKLSLDEVREEVIFILTTPILNNNNTEKKLKNKDE